MLKNWESSPTIALMALVGVCAAWGSTFLIVQKAIGRMPVMDFLAIRFTVAAMVMIALRPTCLRGMTLLGLWRAIGLGVVLGLGYITQTYGLRYASATVSGFITGMFVVFTPVMSWVILRQKINRNTLLAVALATVGLALLSLHDWSVGVGELLTLGCAIFYAVHIVGLGEWSSKYEPYGFSLLHIATVAVIALVTASPGGITMPPDAGIWGIVAITACGYRTRLGEPFTKGGVEHVLKNRFYEGKVVFHPGKSDEHVKDGKHEVPDEVKELWMRCRKVRQQRSRQTEGRPRLPNRSYLFSKVALCDHCGGHYGGQPSHRKSGRVIRRLCHARPFCELKPHSLRVENLVTQFEEGVLPYITLNNDWKGTILNSMSKERDVTSDDEARARIERALKNLRKQHMWEDITDEEYLEQKQEIKRQANAIPLPIIPANLINLDRTAQLLSDLRSLWKHPGVTDLQRESLIREVFEKMHLRGSNLVSIKPKSQYQPLFAHIVTEGVRNGRGERI